jgi:hypothetical protein
MNNKKLTLEEAKALSIKKWEFIVDHNGDEDEDLMFKDFPELQNLKNDCALCELFYDTKDVGLYCCAGCPIRPNIDDYDDTQNTGCYQKIHPYYIWSSISTQENAQKVLDLIKNFKYE